MSTDAVILRCLSGACEEELQMFEKASIMVGGSDSGRSCYVCIGKHCMFFVLKEMDALVQGCGRLPYLQISKAIMDTTTKRFFLLELFGAEGGSTEYEWEGGDRLLIESQHRETLLERIGLCWQAEYMFQTFSVKKFPQARAPIGNLIGNARTGAARAPKGNTDLLQVLPFKGYEDSFSHNGYSAWLRQGFQSSTGLKNGSFVHHAGWEVMYNGRSVVIPGGVQVTLFVGEPVQLMDLETSTSGAQDLRHTGDLYKQELVRHLDQFYVTASGAYMKKMNRTNDIAAWDGWEFFIRAKENVFGCIVLRREYIPPLCDTAQDVAVLLRAPAEGIGHEGCEVLLDECRFIADTVAPVAQVKELYREIIQARLDSLQCTDEAYHWFEGTLGMVPVHKKPAALKFLKSIVKLLDSEGHILDETLLEADVFRDIPLLHDPLLIAQEMLSDAEPLFAHTTDRKAREELRNAWFARVAKYLAFCVNGGIMGGRFTVSTLLQAVSRGAGSGEMNKVLRNVIEFLLHMTPKDDASRSWLHSHVSLTQVLREPETFARYSFNRPVLRTLLCENFLSNEWKRMHRSTGVCYEQLLAALLGSKDLGVPLKTLICRQILENTNSKEYTEGDVDKQVRILSVALVKVLETSPSVSLMSCATAALVNLSCGKDATKNLLISEGVLKLCMKQLKSKDDDLTIYTLYLLVNLTKTPHHRSIVLREGGVPLLVDLLTSSYQNVRKHTLLTQVASVFGQLCNDSETRTLLAEDFPVVPCLLWINDQAQPNTKLKAKLLFALRQLCAGQNKIKIGRHLIISTIEQLACARPQWLDCAVNAVLLLTVLVTIRSNALQMMHQDQLNDALEACGLQCEGEEAKNHRFGPKLWEKVSILKERVMQQAMHGS